MVTAKRQARRWAGACRSGGTLGCLLLLAGCGAAGYGLPLVHRSDSGAPATVAAPTGTSIIAILQARRSVILPGSSAAQMSQTILAGATGAAEAQLRAKRMAEVAKARNWLPSIGPNITLTTMSGLAAAMVAEQALFDGGKRRAERAYAAADVQVAAVALAADTNARVFDGLQAWLTAEQAREQAGVAERAAQKLAEFQKIVETRMQGGLSDPSEVQTISQKLTEMDARRATDLSARAQALAALGALSGKSMDTVPPVAGLPDFSAPPSGTESLSVLRARAEAARARAEADAAKAGLFPTLSATAAMGSRGVDPGLAVSGGRLGFDTAAANRAADAAAEAASRAVDQAAQDALRNQVDLMGQLADLRLRLSQGDRVLEQARGNLDLYVEQYQAGRITLLELVAQYDDIAAMERDQVALKYQMARVNAALARDLGLLVDGVRM